MRLIDSHVHFYDPNRPGGIVWPEIGSPIRIPASPADLAKAAAPIALDGAVAIECSPRLEDDEWTLNHAANEPLILGVIANLRADLDGFSERAAKAKARYPKLKGIRLRPIDRYDLRSPRLIERLARLPALGLTLELGATNLDVLADYTALAEKLPGVSCLLDHFGHPRIDGQEPPAPWKAAMEKFAALPNACGKLTALLQFAAIKPAPTDLAYYRPLLDFLFATFGEQRLLYGSNWPPLTLAGNYADNAEIYKRYLANRPETAEAFFHKNARRIYRLDTPQLDGLTAIATI